MQLYRLRLREDDRLIGYAFRLPWRLGVIALIFGHKPRGLWLYTRAWIDGTPDHR